MNSVAESPFDKAAALFARHCVQCHNDIDREGDFSLQTAASLDESGFVEPSDPASQLLSLLKPDGDDPPSMPKDRDPLSPVEVAAIQEWIESGAEWPQGETITEPVNDFDWWSFKAIAIPPIPEISSQWIRNPIDAFALHALNQRGLTHSREADRRTLIRRIYYDLTGLPPTPDEIEAFNSNSDPHAYEKLVDQLLESDHYGERWARHWLDVVKYADTCGYDKDKLRPNAWPYRDYVIRSLNDDKPYSRFVQEQIAGDVLFSGDPDGILGLGFIAAGPWDFIGHVEVSETKLDGKVARNLDRDEMVSNTLNTFCSVTIQCARCHNHKFDSFTQEHYYSLQGIFAAVDRADRVYQADPKVEQRRTTLEAMLDSHQKAKQKLDAQIAASIETPERVARQTELQASVEKTQKQLDSLPKAKLVYAAATTFKDQSNFKATGGKPRPIHLLHRGNVDQPGDLLGPGLLPTERGESWKISAETPEGERRAQLAKWLTHKNNPLVWRSIVNRVWQHHFGDGLVATPNDFGRMGAEPTHPELLDWLAINFRDGDQSLKQLHRLIVTSSLYRQSSDFDEANAEIDNGNQYLWRMNRRRLSAEEIRDSVLSVSGALNAKMGGPGFYLFELEKTEHSPHFEYHKFDPADPASHRRSIYRFIARSQPNPYMTTLDCADSSQSTPKRIETLTSLQALSLLNNRFSLEMARRFANRLAMENKDLDGQIERSLKLITGRSPNDFERSQLTKYADEHGLENLCRMLFSLSEFVYLD